MDRTIQVHVEVWSAASVGEPIAAVLMWVHHVAEEITAGDIAAREKRIWRSRYPGAYVTVGAWDHHERWGR